MTSTLKTDSNNDIYIGADGKLSIASGLLAVMQACECAAEAQLGEMVLNVDKGIPTMATVWSGAPNIPRFNAAIRQAIMLVPDVVEIKSLVSTVTNGMLTYTAVIKTIYGEAEING